MENNQQTAEVKTESTTTTVVSSPALPTTLDALRKTLIDQNIAVQSVSRLLVSQTIKTVVDILTMEAVGDQAFLQRVLDRLKTV